LRAKDLPPGPRAARRQSKNCPQNEKMSQALMGQRVVDSAGRRAAGPKNARRENIFPNCGRSPIASYVWER
jgi:hypothetical protein